MMKNILIAVVFLSSLGTAINSFAEQKSYKEIDALGAADNRRINEAQGAYAQCTYMAFGSAYNQKAPIDTVADTIIDECRDIITRIVGIMIEVGVEPQKAQDFGKLVESTERSSWVSIMVKRRAKPVK